jgi:hypothetical protein
MGRTQSLRRAKFEDSSALRIRGVLAAMVAGPHGEGRLPKGGWRRPIMARMARRSMVVPVRLLAPMT